LKAPKTFLTNSSLIFVSFIFSFLIIELLFRIYFFGLEGNPFKIQNWVVDGVWDVNKSPVELNYELGWIPKNGIYTYNKPAHTITINNNKLRSNDQKRIKKGSEGLILFSGDSFAFGDGVNDNETFPSIFEAITNKKTLNAGVPAYGIDQMFLRAMNLLQKFPVSDLFFCFIPDDINRCNNSTFHKVRKPYYSFEKNNIKLVPIDAEDFSKISDFNLSLFHKIGGFSLVIDNIMRTFFSEFWTYSVELSKKEEHTNGKEISIILINSLKRECEKNNINFYVIPLAHQRYSINHKKNLKFVLDEIDKDIKIINVFNQLEKIRIDDPSLFASYYLKKNYHYSKLGNEFVAHYIFKELKETSLQSD